MKLFQQAWFCRLFHVVSGSVFCGLSGVAGGAAAFGRAALLGGSVLLALALLEGGRRRPWGVWLLAGALAGGLAGLLMALPELGGAQSADSYRWRQPPGAALVLSVLYGAALLGGFQLLRRQRPWLRWPAPVLSVWLIAGLPLLPLTLGLTGGKRAFLAFLMPFSSAAVFGLFWMLFAVLTSFGAGIGWKRFRREWSILSTAGVVAAALLLLGFSVYYSEVAYWRMMRQDDDEALRQELSGYIFDNYSCYDLASGQREVEWIGYAAPSAEVTAAERREIAALIGRPELEREITGFARSPDRRYVAIVRAGGLSVDGNYLLQVFRVDAPGRAGASVGKLHMQWVVWSETHPAAQEEEKSVANGAEIKPEEGK